MTQIKKYHRFNVFKNIEQTFEITVNSASHYFSCTRAKMADTNYTRKVHWEIARRGELGRERNEKIATVLFAYSAKQEKTLTKAVYSSLWSLLFMLVIIDYASNFKQSTNSCPKTGCHPRYGRAYVCVPFQCFRKEGTFCTTHMKSKCLSSSFLISISGVGADSIVRRIKILCTSV